MTSHGPKSAKVPQRRLTEKFSGPKFKPAYKKPRRKFSPKCARCKP